MNALLVFFGGGIGAVMRYALQLLMGKSEGNSFPFSTFAANSVGCLFIGFLFSYFMKNKGLESYQLFIITGILGGFTTFSSFSLETVLLLKNQHYLIAVFYFFLTNFVGLGLTYILFIKGLK